LQPKAVIITKYISNGSLGDITKRESQRKPLPAGFTPVTKAKIVYGVAQAMAFLHTRDVIHRDLKPDNILLGDNFHPYVADFGLSRRTNRREEDGAIDNMTARLGTPLCMAPELMDEETAVYTGAVDVYAYGVTLYMSLGKDLEYIFDDGSEFTDMNSFSDGIMAGKRYKRPKAIPNQYWQLISDCWAHDPADRPTFAVIARRLESREYALEAGKEDEYMAFIERLKGLTEPKPAPTAKPVKPAQKFNFSRTGSGGK
jgi:serine/threonine protein kinase